MPLEHVHALHDLEAVADVTAQRGIHVGDHGSDAAAVMGADGDHQLGQLNALLHSLHERASAGGDIQQDGVRAGGQLLGHDAGRDEGDAADGGGDVPEGVHLFIRHGDAFALADDRQADLVHLREELLLREGGLGAGDALHLVDGAAGVAESAAAHLGDLDAAGRDDGCDDQRGLVAHAAGGVLVHLDARNGRKIDHDAAVGHHVGQLSSLLVGHAPQIDGHHPCRHLVIGHLAADEAVDDGFQFFAAVGAAVPLFCDQIVNAHKFTLLNRILRQRSSVGNKYDIVLQV